MVLHNSTVFILRSDLELCLTFEFFISLLPFFLHSFSSSFRFLLFSFVLLFLFLSVFFFPLFFTFFSVVFLLPPLPPSPVFLSCFVLSLFSHSSCSFILLLFLLLLRLLLLLLILLLLLQIKLCPYL